MCDSFELRLLEPRADLGVSPILQEIKRQIRIETLAILDGFNRHRVIPSMASTTPVRDSLLQKNTKRSIRIIALDQLHSTRSPSTPDIT